MKLENIKIPYEILNYEKYKQRIQNIINQNNNYNKYPLIEHPHLAYTDCGFPIEHYSIGYGNKHILVMAGTHGCEIIGIDFVTQLMNNIALGNIPNFNPSEFTIDFLPIQNPEGFIISSSAVYYKLAGKNQEEIEQFCKLYWSSYRSDDINSRLNPNDKTKKLHHQLFEGINTNCISQEDIRFKKLKKQVEEILSRKMGPYQIPPESLITWGANGNGVELNANNPIAHRRRIEKFKESSGIVFGTARYNTIPNSIPGPIGISSKTMDYFRYEEENKALFTFIKELNKHKQYYATFNYHGTGGLIYYMPCNLTQNQSEKTIRWKEEHNIGEKFNYNDYINEMISQSYHKETTYRYMKAPLITSCIDDVLRTVYPGFLLIELSKMGGNPIAPYGDYNGNYKSTIQTNLNAFNSSLETIKKLEDVFHQTFYVSRDEINKRTKILNRKK